MNYFETMLALSLLGAAVLTVVDFAFREPMAAGLAMNKTNRNDIKAFQHSAALGTFFFIAFSTEFMLIGH